jgi:hypothetical protein
MSLRSRLERLERVEAEAPADGMPLDFWSWIGREPMPEDVARECQAWARENLPKGPIPSRPGNTERKIQAILDARLAAERPRCGLIELPNGEHRRGPN